MYARSPSIITFVGRPLASRKGLATFIDAIAVLGTLDFLPSFQVWLIGGDVNEQKFLQTIPIGNAILRELVTKGRWMAWGAVENTFLPEIYSRSTVVVIPSTFEQFGLVAIEAMACGCPVVASDVGGLRDTVVPGITGELFAADDAEALANVLAAYLRNPCRRAYHSTNARLWARKFSTDKVYRAYYQVVCNDGPSPLSGPRAPETDWRYQVIESSLPECEEMLNQTIVEWGDCSGKSQVSARLSTDTGEQYHAKFLRPRPNTHSVVLPLSPELQGPRKAAELVAKFQYFSASGLTPTLKASSMISGIVITEWLPKAKEPYDIGNIYSELVRRFAEWGSQAPAINGLRADYMNALRQFAAVPDGEALRVVDNAAALLHAPMLGGALQFQKIHPQVEMFRILKYLERPVWSISAAILSRLETILGLLFQAHPVIIQNPCLQHGSLKPTHVLEKNGQYLACDLDNAAYVVGPLDAVHWCVAERQIEEVDLRDTLNALDQLIPDRADFLLAASWLFVYLVYGLLGVLVRGKKTAYSAVVTQLMTAYEGLFSHGLIRSE